MKKLFFGVLALVALGCTNEDPKPSAVVPDGIYTAQTVTVNAKTSTLPAGMVTFEVVATGTDQIRITQKGSINLAPWQDVSGVYTTYQTGNTVRTDGLSASIGNGVLDIRVGYTDVIARK